MPIPGGRKGELLDWDAAALDCDPPARIEDLEARRR